MLTVRKLYLLHVTDYMESFFQDLTLLISTLYIFPMPTPFALVIDTVMIRFSARGAYLSLVPQGRAVICFLRNNRKFKTKV